MAQHVGVMEKMEKVGLMNKVMVHRREQSVSGQEELVDTGEAWRITASGIGPNRRGGHMDCSCS